MRKPRNFQPPYDENSFREYLQSPVLTLVACWKLVSPTGKVIGATSHTQDLALAGHPEVVFGSATGIVPTAADAEAGLSSAGLELEAIFKDGVLTEEDIASGDWDASKFEVFLVNYKDLEMGELVIFSGNIGEIRTADTRFRAEGRPLSAKASQQVGQLTAEKCNVAALGDARCKVNLDGVALGDGGLIRGFGVVTENGTNVEFFDASRVEPKDYYTNGKVTFTSGGLAGRSMEIKSYESEVVSTVTTIPSDKTWKFSSTLVSNWEKLSYDDSSWLPSVEQQFLGSRPWQLPTNFSEPNLFARPEEIPKWIWSRNTIGQTNAVIAETVYFRYKFTPTTANAVITITADNEFILFVNGVLIGTGTNWNEGFSFGVQLNAAVENLIAVQATNAPAANGTENPAGLIVAIRQNTFSSGTPGGRFVLQNPMSRAIEAGTTYEVIRGCDRTVDTCRNVYGNVVNFRGFPFVPGIEKAYGKKTPIQLN